MSDTDADATASAVPLARLRIRRDGWSIGRQRAFIGALAATGCVKEAAQRVGMSRTSAYRLYHHPEARAFRHAWDEAMALAAGSIDDHIIEIGLFGREECVITNGEYRTIRTVHDARLTILAREIITRRRADHADRRHAYLDYREAELKRRPCRSKELPDWPEPIEALNEQLDQLTDFTEIGFDDYTLMPTEPGEAK